MLDTINGAEISNFIQYDKDNGAFDIENKTNTTIKIKIKVGSINKP